ncbi:arylamine N-acetyltransferase family protein [Fastidiosibacter lacustris]|uniref:arylamine N-acetyltransferase family protein n=1 Tax=Fastidiosibacter lacustris TaxID=2056695 RepID=UPI0013007C73|nr:arylamine N-acetyltransferase [Fastidiosibacter lacustris]
MIFNIKQYLERININQPIEANKEGLFMLHKAHIYNVPFENFEMQFNQKFGLNHDFISDRIIRQKKGGLCFETCMLMANAFDEIGFKYRKYLARVHTPVLTPATHQIFIVELEGQNWLFDIGFGAKGPRMPILLKHGTVAEYSFHSTKIQKNNIYGWIVSIKENIKPDADWEVIYSFYDHLATSEDIEMAYHYTMTSNKSLLKTNRVASLPTKNGRISIRNKTYTEVKDTLISTQDIDSEEDIFCLIKNKFGINLTINQLETMRSNAL